MRETYSAQLKDLRLKIPLIYEDLEEEIFDIYINIERMMTNPEYLLIDELYKEEMSSYLIDESI